MRRLASGRAAGRAGGGPVSRLRGGHRDVTGDLGGIARLRRLQLRRAWRHRRVSGSTRAGACTGEEHRRNPRCDARLDHGRGLCGAARDDACVLGDGIALRLSYCLHMPVAADRHAAHWRCCCIAPPRASAHGLRGARPHRRAVAHAMGAAVPAEHVVAVRRKRPCWLAPTACARSSRHVRRGSRSALRRIRQRRRGGPSGVTLIYRCRARWRMAVRCGRHARAHRCAALPLCTLRATRARARIVRPTACARLRLRHARGGRPWRRRSLAVVDEQPSRCRAAEQRGLAWHLLAAYHPALVAAGAEVGLPEVNVGETESGNMLCERLIRYPYHAVRDSYGRC